MTPQETQTPQDSSSQKNEAFIKQMATKLIISQLTSTLAQLQNMNINTSDPNTIEVTTQAIRDLENVILNLKKKLPNAIWN